MLEVQSVGAPTVGGGLLVRVSIANTAKVNERVQ